MKCPTCADATLTMAERQGVEIDYCPQCRGVWLDRGELDKILERSSMSAPPSPSPASRERPGASGYQGERHGHQQGYHGDKRKKSWLYEIFD